eukprot:CAMPEP_0201621948 /NCGR_PEP_ID=MMETSP0492-20130828/47154_1 /ASSEMBLY_ACC=CAM_ASM_000837 /TAXON_ID=420259 /ORGANISM="Thalassiosira gravida, Strain GMp14c1" /LENGTH=503 /DNA_ID=CAMNT_0048091519 /DNA_START=173 /DNA_END=1686 /DNA_ORIENTATION=-
MTGSAPETHRDGKPTLEYVKGMPKTFASMTNEQILLFAELEIPEACRECIVRDVMVVELHGEDGANFSRQPPYGNLRAFQTLTTPKTSMSENNETKSPHMTPAFVGPLKMTNAIQSTSTVHYSSLSAIAAKLSSSPSYSNATKFIAQTTRSMAGNAPGSHIDGKPTLEYVKGMPKTFASMTNEQILLFAELEIPEACRECIVRDVMAVHNIEYDEAMKVFEKIAKTNREGMALAAFPFYLGFGIAVTAGYASFPLVFHKETVDGSTPGSHIDGKPTLEYVKGMPKTFASMTNEQILLFAELEIPEACRECIVRDVMVVDNVEYDEAMKVFEKIAETNREGMTAAAFPFYLGMGVALTAGYASFPLVFHKETVEWFNEAFVTSELPPKEDLETYFEVGAASWGWMEPLLGHISFFLLCMLETYFEVGAASWGWMEPLLGHISFFLLCMQFSRAQLQNLGIRPYFNWQKERRSRYLIQKYPKYDAEFLANYSRCDRLAEPHDMTH